MKQTLEKMKKFWALLPTDVAANLEFARLVAKGDALHQLHFFDDYSKPILKYILTKGLDRVYYDGREQEISGDYYFFVAEPFNNNTPEWYQLVTYKGIDGEKLQSWLQKNGRQWFIKRHNRDTGVFTGTRLSPVEKKAGRRPALLDDLLNTYIHQQFAEEVDYNAEQGLQSEHRRLAEVVKQLPQRDQEILCVTIADELDWQQRWEMLQEYMPEFPYSQEELSAAEKKAVQDRLAILKRNSLKKLKAMFNPLQTKK